MRPVTPGSSLVGRARRRAQPQGDPGAPAERMDSYGHLFPGAEDLGRGAIDAIFAVVLTEQGRNQQVR